MGKGGKRSKRQETNSSDAELDAIRKEIRDQGEKVREIAKDKDKLRFVNQALVEKIKKLENENIFKLLEIRWRFEKQRELSDLALQKNVTTIRCIFEAVAVQLASLAKRAMKDSGKKIMLFDKKEMIKEIKVFDDDVKVFEVRNPEAENKALKKELEILKDEKNEKEKENEVLANENHKLNEIYTAKCLASQVLASSLEELLFEQEEQRIKKTEDLQNEIKQLETENKSLMEERDDLVIREVELEKKNNVLSTEMQLQNEMYTANCLASQAIVASLEEIIAEGEQGREKVTKGLQSKAFYLERQIDSQNAEILELKRHVMVVEEQKLELEKSLQLKEGDIKEKELQDRAVKRHVVEVERKCKKLEEELEEVKDYALHVCWEFKMNMENEMKDKEVKMEEDLVKLQSHVDVICAEKDKKIAKLEHDVKTIREKCAAKTKSLIEEKKLHVKRAVASQNEIVNLRNEVAALRYYSQLMEETMTKKTKDVSRLRPWLQKKIPWLKERVHEKET